MPPSSRRSIEVDFFRGLVRLISVLVSLLICLAPILWVGPLIRFCIYTRKWEEGINEIWCHASSR